ncbi:hypothetical protein BS47DRAFT_1368555 [Hydnum rufescens UP504]|uniref:Uncharacterized protein n=1 Tax=Hydnum rufescens UP504 TaxID=1448309 RepID=A0A9P6AFQ2_9AGAM|nr:hypothetical protein BS47DRAFT_1368555 [Hydnum rufescens UP504]
MDTHEAKTTNETATNKTIGKNAANEWLYEPYTCHGRTHEVDPPNKDLKQGVNHKLGMPQMNHTPTVAGHNWSEVPGETPQNHKSTTSQGPSSNAADEHDK